MAVAILAYFIIVDFPTSDKNKFLTEEEKKFVVARLAQDRGVEDDKAKVNWSTIVHTFLDWKIWSFSMMYFAGAGYVNDHVLQAETNFILMMLQWRLRFRPLPAHHSPQ